MSDHTPQLNTNLVEIRKEELVNIQSLIGIGLARIAKAENLTSMPGAIPFNYKQNEDRD